MKHTSVYHRVQEQAKSRKRFGYTSVVHERVDRLIEEYDREFGLIEGYDSSVIGWVQRRYSQKYGMILGWILSGLISWLVQLTLDQMFGRNS